MRDPLNPHISPVIKHYAALRTSWTMANGNPKDYHRPRNRHLWLSFITFLTDLMASGKPSLSSTCHRWRQEALDTSSKKKFQASTVSRSVEWAISDVQVQRAKEDAEGRWMRDVVWDRALLERIDRYIDILPLSAPSMEAPASTPNDRACLGCPRKKGGQAAAAQKLVMDELERDYQAARDLFTLRASSNFLEKTTYVDNRDVVRNLQSVTLHQRETSTIGTTPEEALEYANRKFTRDYLMSPPPLEPCSVTELGGKIRVVTLHSIEEVLIARNVTARWLSQLRRVVTTRDILRNRPVELETTEGDGDIFSADLTAATDFIPHEVAQRVATKLYERIGAPCSLDTLLKIFGPHQLPDGRVTKGGIHMGLGPTWIVLCLLNGFAAWNAGAHKDDHRICGDDLVAIWRNQTAMRYTSTLESLGMVVNHSKSFFTVAGVFCERLVVRTGTGTARARQVGHLSQSSAARVIAGRTRERLVVAQELWSENQIPILSRETAYSLTPRVRDGGPLRLGGKGRGLSNAKQLEAVLRFGSVKLVRSAYRLPPGSTVALREAEKEAGDVPVSNLLISATTRLRLQDNFRGKKSKEAKPVTSSDFISDTRARKRKCQGTTKSLLAAVTASSLRSKDRKLAQWLVKRPRNLSHHGLVKWLQRVVTRPRAERYLSRHDATQWLQSISRVRWELGPKELPKKP
jgi:hypothetical protein